MTFLLEASVTLAVQVSRLGLSKKPQTFKDSHVIQLKMITVPRWVTWNNEAADCRWQLRSRRWLLRKQRYKTMRCELDHMRGDVDGNKGTGVKRRRLSSMVAARDERTWSHKVCCESNYICTAMIHLARRRGTLQHVSKRAHSLLKQWRSERWQKNCLRDKRHLTLVFITVFF